MMTIEKVVNKEKNKNLKLQAPEFLPSASAFQGAALSEEAIDLRLPVALEAGPNQNWMETHVAGSHCIPDRRWCSLSAGLGRIKIGII